MEDENLEELEQQLYAQVYHDASVEAVPEESPNTSAVTPNQSTNMRYWQTRNSNNITNTKQNFKPKQRYKKFPSANSNKSQENKESESKSEDVPAPAIAKPYFVPYSSVLSFLDATTSTQPIEDEIIIKSKPTMPVEPEQSKSYEKKKSKPPKFPKEKGKFLKPSKKLTKEKYESKKLKAAEVRKKTSNKPVVIDLASSSDDDDSVVQIIENPAPPLISLDSSDDETSKRKKRGASPSTSSMISDDFIVTSDKRRLVNPFASAEHSTPIVDNLLKDALKESTRMKKMKALTKVSSSSSSSNSNSARSSCERVENEKNSNSSKSKKKRDKVCNLNANETDDSKFATICAMTSKKCNDTKTQAPSSSSSDEEDNSICVTAKEAKVRRRKSTSSRKGKDSDNEESNQKLSTTPLAHKKKRSRFITPNYNEDEFATLISTAIQAADDNEEAIDTINTGKALIDALEKENEQTIVEIKTSQEDQNDCQIIEKKVPTYNVSDEEDAPMDSDSEDSIKNVSNDLQCDLTLNIRRSNHTPHEFFDTTPEENRESPPKTQSAVLDCEVGWNDEMRYFYNECTFGRDFCITTIKNAMPTDPKLWRVNHADKTRMMADGDRKIRCRNCNEWGHKERFCPRPRKKIICYMCGQTGHRETRCPNAICLRCGRPNDVYATMCGSCSKFVKRTCPLCQHKGHDIDQCPDKWRRYHSTTTMTESSALDITFRPNHRLFCSLCARSGHFAENCSYINKMFHGLIKSSWFVISSKPSYPTNYSFNAARENEHVLQLITYMENYSFNLKLPSNCQFYPKFRESFLRHQEQLYGGREVRSSKSKQKRKRGDKKSENKEKSSQNDAEDNKTNDSNVHHDDSNSNYSFSEFYKPGDRPNDENQERVVERINNSSNQPLGDFIPLSSANNQLVPVEPQKVCDFRVMLTKEHATIFMSQKGQNLLFDLCEKFNVVSQFKFDSFGNSLCLTGLPLNQQLFHKEMKDFLYKCGLDEYEKMIEKTTQIPKIIGRIVSYLRSNFQSIKHNSIRDTKQLLDRLTMAEKTLDHRKAIKCRRALNIIFIGLAELGDGAMHMRELKKILGELEREIELGKGDSQVDARLRNQISIHIRYVFSAIDHSNLYGDYRKMFDEYRKVMMRRSNNSKSITSNSSPIIGRKRYRTRSVAPAKCVKRPKYDIREKETSRRFGRMSIY